MRGVYGRQTIHSRIVDILKARKALYEQAKAGKPERWSGQTRDWSRAEVVMLNPDKPIEKNGKGLQEVA